jgi:hypothetical protein
MSAVRTSFMRAANLASRRTAPTIGKHAIRAFTTTPKANDYEVISEKEIPATQYKPGSGAQRVTIPVEESHSAPAAKEAAVDVVTPLTESAFKGMSPTMQKMSLMGKVVVVTGYVHSPFQYSFPSCTEITPRVWK